MIVEEDIKLFLENKIPEIVNHIQKSRDCFRFRCPLCGDSKKSRLKARGNYYRREGTYHCFNCGTTIAGLWIISQLGDIDINEVKKEYLRSFIQLRNEPQQLSFKKEVKVVEEFEVPDNWVDIPKDTLQTHVINRKVLDAQGSPKNWRLYYNEESDRIVIPWIRNGKIVYYQERAIRHWQPEKYKFPSSMKKDIFGIDEIDETWKYILFNEGCFDSVFLPNGIAIGGLYPTVEQLTYLQNLGITHELIWFPDNPWMDQSTHKKIINQASKTPNQKIFMWSKSTPVKDVNDLVLNINDINFFFNNKSEIENRITTLSKAVIMLKFDNDVL